MMRESSEEYGSATVSGIIYNMNMKGPKQKGWTLRNHTIMTFSVFKKIGKVSDKNNCFNIFMTRQKLLWFVEHLGQLK